MQFISAFITAASEVATGFGAVLVNGLTAITPLFYADSQLTILGGGLALAVGVGVVYLIWRMVRGLIKTNERG